MTPYERKRTSKTTLYECKRNEQDHPIRTQEKKNKWTTYKNTKNLRNTIYISKFIVPKSFKRSCVTAKSFERFCISQYISKYFEIYFEIFQLQNISKIVSKYFKSGFEIFFEIFCNRNNSKYFRTGWISWIS